MTDPIKTDETKKNDEKEISDTELENVAGGRPMAGGYGTLDYKTMTSHGGD